MNITAQKSNPILRLNESPRTFMPCLRLRYRANYTLFPYSEIVLTVMLHLETKNIFATLKSNHFLVSFCSI